MDNIKLFGAVLLLIVVFFLPLLLYNAILYRRFLKNKELREKYLSFIVYYNVGVRGWTEGLFFVALNILWWIIIAVVIF